MDVGTQGTKALVYEQKTGKVISRGAKAYDILKSNVPGRAEQHPSLWIEVAMQRPTAALPFSICVSLPVQELHAMSQVVLTH